MFTHRHGVLDNGPVHNLWAVNTFVTVCTVNVQLQPVWGIGGDNIAGSSYQSEPHVNIRDALRALNYKFEEMRDYTTSSRSNTVTEQYFILETYPDFR